MGRSEMSRGIGESGVVDQLPEWVVLIAGFVTQLGDMWFVLVAIGVIYWVGSRDRSLTRTPLGDSSYLLAVAVGAYALTAVAKHAFGLPRPPGATTAVSPGWLPSFGTPVYESLVTAEGYGFPSGHALKSTAVYGGGTLVLRNWSIQRHRYVGAATVVLAVALSRVALGVHYVVDVVVGICLGGGFLWGLWTIAGDDPRRAFAVAGLLGLLAVAVSLDVNAVLAVVTSVVGLGAWEYWVTDR